MTAHYLHTPAGDARDARCGFACVCGGMMSMTASRESICTATLAAPTPHTPVRAIAH